MKPILTVLAGVAAWLLSTPTAPAQDKNEIPAAVVKSLEEGGKLEVFYLKDEKDKGGFRNYKVVGDPVELKDEKSRKKLIETLVKGVEASKPVGPREFSDPNYGLRVTDIQGKRTEILISLDTAWGFAYQNGKRVGQFRISGESKKAVGKSFETQKGGQ